MPYIGQQPTSVAFLTDTFSGNGSTTAFTLSAAPANTSSVLVAVSGVLQDPSTYSVSGTTLTFSGAPPSGTSNISVRFLGIPASGVTTTAYRTVTEFTATASQTTFSVPSYTVGFIDVYRNGVMLGSADYTATNGTTVVLASGATSGDLIEVISFQVSSVLNAVQTTGGTFSGNVLFASGNGIWNTSGNLGVGTASPVSLGTGYGTVDVRGSNGGGFRWGSATNSSYTYSDSAGLVISTANALPFILSTNNTERMRLNSAGNVGIGTSSPLTRFTVSGGYITQTDGTVNTYLGADGSGGALVGTQTNQYFRFITNDTERMRISSSGYVTAPYQPAFTVSGGTNASGTVNPVIMTNVFLNRGSNYNSSNGRFTAPVAGVYFFSASVDPLAGGNVSTQFYKNGVYIPDLRCYANNADSSQAVSAAIPLAVGDYVTVATNAGFEGSLSQFSGFLIG